MTITIRGIGWVTSAGYGCIRSCVLHPFLQSESINAVPKQDIFSAPFKNFGRMDGISRMTAYGVALALRDADIEYASAKKQDIGIIGTSRDGSLQSDIDYFKDYIAGGRTLSRANLFIYTLPTSPLGEAAIHFGLMGPLLYASRKNQALLADLDLAAEMILNNETHTMLVGQAEEDASLYVVLQNDQRDNAICSLESARMIMQSEPKIDDMIRQFSLMREGKG